MRFLKILVLGGLILSLTSTAFGGNTCSHRIIIRILKTNKVIMGKYGNTLSWATDDRAKKITVGIKPKLKKLAVEIETTKHSGKRTSKRILVRGLDKDFIPTIFKQKGKCNIKYFLLNKNNTKKEIPQVTYTITDIF